MGEEVIIRKGKYEWGVQDHLDGPYTRNVETGQFRMGLYNIFKYGAFIGSMILGGLASYGKTGFSVTPTHAFADSAKVVGYGVEGNALVHEFDSAGTLIREVYLSLSEVRLMIDYTDDI